MSRAGAAPSTYTSNPTILRWLRMIAPRGVRAISASRAQHAAGELACANLPIRHEKFVTIAVRARRWRS